MIDISVVLLLILMFFSLYMLYMNYRTYKIRTNALLIIEKELKKIKRFKEYYTLEDLDRLKKYLDNFRNISYDSMMWKIFTPTKTLEKDFIKRFMEVRNDKEE